VAQHDQRAATRDDGAAGGAGGGDGLGTIVHQRRDRHAEIGLRAAAEDGRAAGNPAVADDLKSAIERGADVAAGHVVGAAAVDDGIDNGAAGPDVRMPPLGTCTPVLVWPEDTVRVRPLLTVAEIGVTSVPLLPSVVRTNWVPE
jgi:hypothetical protein